MNEKIETALGRFATKSEIDQLPKHLRDQVAVDARGNPAHRGFLKRSHFFRILRCILSPSEFVVVDFLWDAAWGGQDSNGSTRKSLSKIEEGTSLKTSAIKVALKSLQAHGLIVMREKSMRRGVLWDVPSFMADATESKSDLVEDRPSRETTNTRSENAQPVSRNPTRYKELSKEILLENSLSDYFSSLKAPQKREREVGHFQGLLREYAQKDIVACLAHVQAHGLPVSGEPVHSPMAYLAQAMGDVLKAVRAGQMRQEQAAKTRDGAAQATRERQEQEIREQNESEARRQAFESAFQTPESQEAILAGFRKRTPWAPKGNIGRGLAIADWWEHRAE
ncbi:MAG: hypothetical protein HY074_16405 [Deltaproteobacteria bacterium]|nr:hypothetical protein [Deltaproteobacteria bacterium]